MVLRFMTGELVRSSQDQGASGAEQVKGILSILHEEPLEVGKVQHLGLLVSCVNEWLCIVGWDSVRQELEEIEEMYGLSK